ncbi:lipopolysaccharide heptosyltransferase I [Trinickia caryophylli]|uniref:Lipopolysaccharide heptosyltransferase 1 n=1 Tax=Trinickia caryophylli TaxID=28094 RepID=A0A1X7GTG5_TRICW|nr:lipopolysaccharide heptosyltransferase I [Trinickia caryophylli]PMS08926.1 lipopolysaccharide heptosyltransferase I [Trinickia caryophylli]TRX18134.1 lipopolysaccharide heptosyltransferase I [Trinickia caryophylli]WQE11082.1 lipopolysaccharide heptosyltransferase I [Trinickia caryophylli]SMF74465.1 heptosyltransferase-1 [Trinickia caryophylli]GLU35237.1 LPS heptosyltransferase-1 [Trinickia caryophylli]
MNRLLIIKVTSLGDIVQAQPLVADLQRAFPGVKIDWAADAAFTEVLRWNTGIDRVLGAPLRQFKKRPRLADLQSIAASIAELRRVKYDAIIDVHGVYKSAIIAFLARGRVCYGYRSVDLGEKGAAFAYTRRMARPAELNAWEGLRLTVSEAFGYPIEAEAEFGLRIPAPPSIPPAAQQGPFAILLHATSADNKKWPISHWQQVGGHIAEQGIRTLLPWGSEQERAEAQAIAEAIPGATVLPSLTVREVAQHIDLATLVIGTDTGFAHLASAIGKPTVMIFTATSRHHFGVNIPGRAVSVGGEGCTPSVSEVLAALRSVWQPAPSRAAVSLRSI